MGREFTNALNETPLWQFALQTYEQHQQALLHWQQTHHSNVNILLVLAFCQQNQQHIPIEFSTDTLFAQIERLTRRVRKLRRGCKDRPELYDHAKYFELMLEGMQIIRLQQWCAPTKQREFLVYYEKTMGIKKGALAPFIATLLY